MKAMDAIHHLPVDWVTCELIQDEERFHCFWSKQIMRGSSPNSEVFSGNKLHILGRNTSVHSSIHLVASVCKGLVSCCQIEPEQRIKQWIESSANDVRRRKQATIHTLPVFRSRCARGESSPKGSVYAPSARRPPIKPKALEWGCKCSAMDNQKCRTVETRKYLHTR